MVNARVCPLARLRLRVCSLVGVRVCVFAKRGVCAYARAPACFTTKVYLTKSVYMNYLKY